MALTQYTIQRSFDVPAARLFRAFTEADDLEAWVWGPGVKGFKAEIDLRIGGMFDISIDPPADGSWGTERVGVRGMYLVIEPGKKLIHTVHWDPPIYRNPGKSPLDEVLVVNIAGEGEGSTLSYLHMGIPDDGMSAKEHERSVRVTLDLLAKHLEGG